MNRKIIGIVIFIAFISGCNPSYIEPQSGSFAKLIVKNETNYTLLAINFEDTKVCSDPRGVPAIAANSQRILNVKSEQREIFVFQALGINGKYIESCILMPSFILENNKQYEAKITLGENACYLSLINLTSNENINSLVLRKYRTPLVSSQGFCEPLQH